MQHRRASKNDFPNQPNLSPREQQNPERERLRRVVSTINDFDAGASEFVPNRPTTLKTEDSYLEAF
jgi:hypothetical protein